MCKYNNIYTFMSVSFVNYEEKKVVFLQPQNLIYFLIKMYLFEGRKRDKIESN